MIILTPTAREARAVHGARVVAAGGDIAAAIARVAPDAGEPVIIAGVCGGLDPSLRAGTIVLARSVFRGGASDLIPSAAPFDSARRALRRRGIDFVSAAMLTTTVPVPGKRAKTDLWNTYGAAGVDMESYAIAAALHERGIPWVVVRSVVDTAAMSLPPSLHTWSAEQDERALVRAIASRPREWAGYAHLALNMRRSLKTLAAAVGAIASAAPAIDSVPQERITVRTLT